MTGLLYFTAEEQQLISLFMPEDNRVSLMKTITKAGSMDTDVQTVAESVLDKLARMTDEEYLDTSFEEAL